MQAAPRERDCFNDAAQRLPEGWQATVSLERGYGGVSLTNPNGDAVEVDPIPGEPLADCVRRATTIAVNRHRRATANS
jgi:hypothetical protein